MKIRIDHVITKEHLVWAAYQILTREDKISKGLVLSYLKDQITIFGSDNSSLFGENYHEGGVCIALYEEAKEWVERKFI